MKVAVYIGRASHQQQWCGAFVEGMRAHGLEPEIVQSPRPDDRAPVDCDVAVFWGYRRRAVIRHQKRNGGRFIVLERGYLGARMSRWTSAGWGGLNGRADFRVDDDMPADRWEEHFEALMQPWRGRRGPHGGTALILGQVPGDASVHGVDLDAWYAKAATVMRNRGFAVWFRPHPMARQALPIGLDVCPAEGLDDALAEVRVAVTYNSNSGVDAVLAGVPTIACDPGSMAWPVATQGLEALLDMEPPPRERWAHRLAYCQWQEHEFRSGAVWAHLNR